MVSIFLALLSASTAQAQATPPDVLAVADFTSLEGWRAFAWPDRDDAQPTSRVAISQAATEQPREKVLQIDYAFPSDRSTQVCIDYYALPPCANYAELVFSVRGDGSGNVLEVWTGEQARGWHGVGSLPLDFSDWRTVTLRLEDNFTALAHTLRFIIRRADGHSEHTIFLDDIVLRRPVEKTLPADYSFGPEVAGPPPFRREKEFRVERRRMGDRTVALVDGEPLVCILDALPDSHYLDLARRAGANCFSLDLYWRDLEPLPGFSNWGRLRRFVDWLGEAGFAVIMLVNIHQPRWLLAQRGDEPLDSTGVVYPNAPLVRQAFTRFLERFLPEFAPARNLIAIGVSGGGEAAASFPEVPGLRTPWRESPTLLADFRAFLASKYADDKAWRKAWQVENPRARIEEAVPPEPLGDPNGPWTDFRQSWHDWREFADRWWVATTGWQAEIVKRLLPGRLVMVRFGWPVFQCENVFLARQAPGVDMVQCMDAVPTWEAATPWFLVSRAALYHGALRGTDKVNFIEVDVGHNRGRPTSEDMVKYLPPLAPFIGALWYYRGVHEAFVEGFAQAVGRLREGIAQPSHPEIAVFYGQKYANWTQHHANYANEAALAGAARVLGEAGLSFTVVSEYTLGDLQEMRAVVLADNPILPREAAVALEQFAKRGGKLVIEDVERRDLQGRPCALRLPATALTVPAGFFASVQPRGEGITMTAAQQQIAQQVVEYLRERG